MTFKGRLCMTAIGTALLIWGGSITYEALSHQGPGTITYFDFDHHGDTSTLKAPKNDYRMLAAAGPVLLAGLVCVVLPWTPLSSRIMTRTGP